MGEIILSLFSIGIMDFFTPTGIPIILVISKLVKNKIDVLIYIIADYVAYLSVALTVYFCVSHFLVEYVTAFVKSNEELFATIRIVLGIIVLIFAIAVLIFLFYKIRRHESLELNKIVKIESGTRAFLILFAFVCNWSCAYGFVPLYTFIAVLFAHNVSFPGAVPWLMCFCLFAIGIKLIVYLCLVFIKNEKATVVINKISTIVTYIFLFLIPAFSLGLSIWLLQPIMKF